MPDPANLDLDDAEGPPSQGPSKSTIIALVAVLLLGGAFVVALVAFGGGAEPPPVFEEEEVDPTEMEGSLLSASGSIIGDLLRRGERAMQQGRYTAPPGANVRDFIKEVDRLNPGNPLAKDLERRAHDTLAKAGDEAYQGQQWERAATVYRELVRFTPADRAAVDRLASVEAALKGSPPAPEAPPVQ